MENKFIEIIAKDGEFESQQLTVGFPWGTKFCNNGSKKSAVPISDIKEVVYKKGGMCSVWFFSDGEIEISEHEYNRLKAVLMGGELTNEEILKAMHKRGEAGYGTAMNLARADEREKMTDEQIANYLAYLSDKEKALVLLNYLLRGGITDDDLRGLRLQWIKNDFCKCDSPDREAGYTYCHKCHKHVSDERFEQLTTEAT